MTYEERNALIGADYQSGMTLRQVGAKYGISRQSVLTILRSRGIPRRPAGGGTEGRRTHPSTGTLAELIVARYCEGWTLKGIRDATGMATQTIRRILIENGVAIRRPFANSRKVPLADIPAIIAARDAGEKPSSIAARYGVTTECIRLILRQNRATRSEALTRYGGLLRAGIRSAPEAARELGIDWDQVESLCRAGAFPGAFLLEDVWIIPRGAVRLYAKKGEVLNDKHGN